MATPYCSVQMLLNAPTGVPWNSIPQAGSQFSPAQTAEMTNILWRASNIADAKVNQPLRSTVSVEQVQGPDYRMTVDQSGVGRAMLSRWPVTQLLAGRVSPRATIPRSWSPIPLTAMALEDPPITLLSPVVEGASGAGGSAVLIAPGYVSWASGRNGYTFESTYLNGWPHAGVTADVTAGTQAVAVDDVTGMAGATCFFYDGAFTETVTVATATATAPVTLPAGGTVQAGPGIVTLSAPLAYNHSAETVLSALPQDIAWATILIATSQVLDSGMESITAQTLSGSTSLGGKGVADLAAQIKDLLAPYRRVI